MSTPRPESVEALRDLTEEELAHILSQDTWKNTLNQAERDKLANFLPRVPNHHEPAQPDSPHVAWIAEPNLFWSSPIQKFQRLLNLGPAEMNKQRADLARNYALLALKSHNDLVDRLNAYRAHSVPPRPQPPRMSRVQDQNESILFYSEQGGLKRRGQKPHSVPTKVSPRSQSPTVATESRSSPQSLQGILSNPDSSSHFESDSPVDAKYEGVFPEGFSPKMCFFALVRDALRSVPQELAPAEYVKKQVQVQAEMRGLLNMMPKGASLTQYIGSVLQWMATPASVHAARTNAHILTAGNIYSEPLLHFQKESQSYRWMLPGNKSSNQALLPLEAMHYEHFVSQYSGVDNSSTPGGGAVGRVPGAPPMKSLKMSLTLPPGSATQLALFRKQELDRFNNPDQKFTYTLRDGSSATVPPIGPRKSVHGKVRDHFLLSPSRPGSVTVLALVRDAAARLPAGEGSRADVCELLKESGFVVPGYSDAQVSQVVSGALDRLNYDRECVRFDAERKVWMYTACREASGVRDSVDPVVKRARLL